ncbi:hypothetical protein [Streptomyces sp. NPDC059247]|uniref:hypothetical protein n=1 Tax=Streptomyces sp. NPDC059247 TaxID=3346790 RepID=UPI0036A2F179
MSGTGNYQADTVGLRQTILAIEDTAETPKKLLARFDGAVGNYAPWKGEDDDLHDQLKLQEDQQNETVRGVLGGVGGVLTGLRAAVLESLTSIQNVQRDVQERIHDGRSNGDGGDTGGHGKR